MNARAMTTMNGPARLAPGRASRSWLAVAFDWPMLMRRMWGAQAGKTGFSEAGFSEAGAADILPRRWRDRHPDAPPRRPLLASRDLPPANAADIRAEAGPVIQPVALPRSPEPMNEAQIAQLMAAATARATGPSLPTSAPDPCWPRMMPASPADPREPTPSPAAMAPTPALILDQPDMDAAAVEAALAKALATLRKLAEQAPANRRR